MKRIFTLLLALVMCVALFACGEEPCTAHTDQNGDGYCNNDRDPSNSSSLWYWGTEGDADNTINLNPYVPTKEVYVNNCGDLVLIIPQTPQFEDTKLYIDGVLQN